MRLLREFTKEEAMKMTAEDLENKIERLIKRADNLEIDNPKAAEQIRDKVEELYGVLKAKKAQQQTNTNESHYIVNVGLNELRSIIRATLSEAKKKEKDEAKKEEKARKKKKKTPLEEQEATWGGRRSKWYMPRLSDR
jgi:hypothetical protein